MQALNGKQRKALRGMAHERKALVQVGAKGLTEAVLAQLEAALEDHELIKVKFLDHKDAKDELAERICATLHCADVGHIGHQVILFRPARDPKRRKIRVPSGAPADAASAR